MGCFAYSPVEGATANALANPVPDEVRKARQEQVMAHQADISAARLSRWVGRRVVALIDDVDEEEGCLIGRTAADAPEIDGVIRIHRAPDSRHPVSVEIGSFVEVEVTDSDDYDLDGFYRHSIKETTNA